MRKSDQKPKVPQKPYRAFTEQKMHTPENLRKSLDSPNTKLPTGTSLLWIKRDNFMLALGNATTTKKVSEPPPPATDREIAEQYLNQLFTEVASKNDSGNVTPKIVGIGKQRAFANTSEITETLYKLMGDIKMLRGEIEEPEATALIEHLRKNHVRFFFFSRITTFPPRIL